MGNMNVWPLYKRNVTLTIFGLNPLLGVVMARHFYRLTTVLITYSRLVWSGGIWVFGPPELRAGR
jgi:hypothetical protein